MIAMMGEMRGLQRNKKQQMNHLWINVQENTVGWMPERGDEYDQDCYNETGTNYHEHEGDRAIPETDEDDDDKEQLGTMDWYAGNYGQQNGRRNWSESDDDEDSSEQDDDDKSL